MPIKIIIDETNEELKETKRTYELSVPVILTQENNQEYELDVIIVYDETIHPDESGKNWLNHFEVDLDEKPLPYPTNFTELECRLTRVLVDLTEAGKISADKDRPKAEIFEIIQQIISKIREIAEDHEILT